MDFDYLLELAKSNDKVNKKEAAVSRFSTKLSRPKKEDRRGPKVEAVKAVINKMIEDKQKETEEARKKKENLLALRAQDRKSNKRVNAMIKMSKGASKSVLDDAKDLTTAQGEEQCDEDDYGYESNMSQQIFSKLANRYASMPDDDKLKFVKNNKKGSIDDIKNRVINNLKKQEEEESSPRKRKRKSQNSGGGDPEDDFINDGDAYDGTPLATKPPKEKDPSKKVVNVNLTNYKSDKYNNFKYDHKKEEREKERKEKKAREKSSKKAASSPPMSFEEILRVAQQKHKEVPLISPREELLKDKEKEKKKEPDRPLTAKEKEELEEERRRKLRRMGKLPPEKKPAEGETEGDKKGKGDKMGKKGEGGSSSSSGSSSSGSGGGSKLKKALESPQQQQQEQKSIDRSKYFAVPFSQKPREPPQARDPKAIQSPRPQSSSSRPDPYRETKPQRPQSKDARPFKAPPPPKGRPGPPPPMHKKPPRPASPPGKMRIESDDEDEYDSEMDDFIDDGEDEMDVSSEIKRMFGYDRNKYQDEDDDVDDMEASFSQMQKEERISAKIGLKEDLEDMKREEEEKKLKMLRLKQAKKAARR